MHTTTFIFPRPQKYGGFWTRECSTEPEAESERKRLEREEEKTHPKIEKAYSREKQHAP
jgi:hypothetical protein